MEKILRFYFAVNFRWGKCLHGTLIWWEINIF